MTPTTPTYVYEPAVIPLQLTLTANQPLNLQKVNIDKDSDFILTGIHGTSTGSYTINFRLPSGRQFANGTQIRNTNLVGTANQPAAIGPELVYPAGGIGPAVDITETSGAGNTIEIIFSGLRRFTV